MSRSQGRGLMRQRQQIGRDWNVQLGGKLFVQLLVLGCFLQLLLDLVPMLLLLLLMMMMMTTMMMTVLMMLMLVLLCVL